MVWLGKDDQEISTASKVFVNNHQIGNVFLKTFYPAEKDNIKSSKDTKCTICFDLSIDMSFVCPPTLCKPCLRQTWKSFEMLSRLELYFLREPKFYSFDILKIRTYFTNHQCLLSFDFHRYVISKIIWHTLSQPAGCRKSISFVKFTLRNWQNITV